MKTISRLNTLTSLQTAETMALKAAKAAEAARRNRKTEAEINAKKARKKKQHRTPSIEKEIRSIFNSMSSDIAQTTKAVMLQPAKGACCKGIISVYTISDLQREKTEGIKAKPYATYTFYPSTLDASRLGSVAIYAADPLSLLMMIRRSGFLFGHKVVRAKLEMGIRPFVDVTLR